MRQVVACLLKKLGGRVDEFSLHFVTEKEIGHLHADFFDDPSPTDCISLPIDSPFDTSLSWHVLGEVFICPAVAKVYAQKHRQDPYKETLLYVIHGLLHLYGFDDIQPKDRRQMRAKEKQLLKLLEQEGFLKSSH